MDEYEVITNNNNFLKFDKKVKSKITESSVDEYVILQTLKDLQETIKIDCIKIKEKCEMNIYCKFKPWLKYMKDSFKDSKDIVNQFINDLPRFKLYCNETRVNNPYDFFDYLEYKCDKKTMKTILMFCTQTSLALPFEIIQKSLYKYNDNHYLSQITSQSGYHRIYLTINDEVEFVMKKVMRIFKIRNGNDYTIFHVIIQFNFNLKNNYINFQIKYKPLGK